MSAPLASSSIPSTPSASRSPSPSSPSLQKVRMQPTSDSSSTTSTASSSNPSWRRSHIRSKSSSSVSPPPSMIRAHSLPLPNRGFPKIQGPPPPPKWTTTPASPTYRNSFVPTFPSPTSGLPATKDKRPSFLRTATPPPATPPRMPPAYLVTEAFPGSLPSSGQLSSYPPSLTSNASSPTSSRSCSPSLTTYSLETIEDSPDGELLAILEEEEERQQREQSEKDRDADSVGLGLSLVTSSMNNMSLRETKRRQRWSVCGAERRSDFYLETITED
ncbi:hypothetical protein H072_1177 [Dactylellina haptotyla CBS 200.50]|uniref:Uncharacterized protein n=1 Tax=Dactylellina haptotyla (strain CBS 200.50) TaxID=1284197 RepID=S8APJ9_DACHA|nr:hypothetical protein H072_1177 [Dactylellina haptotyla CBS 200.50]